MTMDERRLSGEWNDLGEAGKVPDEGKGETAKRAQRDAHRQRRRFPSEDRRVGRKITPTLSAKLVRRLRTICKAEGQTGPDGDGIIASPLIEDLLWAAVEAYERGEFHHEDHVIEVRQRLRRGSRRW